MAYRRHVAQPTSQAPQRLPWPTRHDLVVLGVTGVLALGQLADDQGHAGGDQANPAGVPAQSPGFAGATAAVIADPRPAMRDYLNRTPISIR